MIRKILFRSKSERHWFYKPDDINMEKGNFYENYLNNLQIINDYKNNKNSKVTELQCNDATDFTSNEINKKIFNSLKQYNDRQKDNNRKRKNYICNYCFEENKHLSNECPHKFCTFCKTTGHLQFKCPKKQFCQYCGSNTHSTFNCNSPEIQERLKLRFIKCHNCGVYGHYAIDCFKPVKKFYNNNNNNNYKNFYSNKWNNRYYFRNYNQWRGRGRYNYNNYYNYNRFRYPY